MQRKESKPRGSDHRPTRQHIAYLGGILQDDVKHVERRAAFWAKATAKLDALSKRVSREERRKLEAALEVRIHSITSSAKAISLSGILRPSALAVVRLMTSSNLVGCTTGRSAGLVPLRIFPT